MTTIRLKGYGFIDLEHDADYVLSKLMMAKASNLFARLNRVETYFGELSGKTYETRSEIAINPDQVSFVVISEGKKEEVK